MKKRLSRYGRRDFKESARRPEREVVSGFEDLASKKLSIEDRVEEFTQKSREGWERFFRFLSRLGTEKEDEARREVEEELINAAVGRPVTRIILDKNDNVILNKGDIITYASIRKAKGSGVLENILNSIGK
jgi:predicted transcriptional regulator